MKTKSEYTQELKDLMVDLESAIDNKDTAKVSEIIILSLSIISDIKEANY